MKPALLWLRQDLRLEDNPALTAALAEGPVLPLYILDESCGAASRWWLHHTLTALAADFAARGATLILRRGEPATILADLAAQTGAASVHTARSFAPAQRQADRAVDTALRPRGVAFHRHPSISLFPPERIKTKTGGAYGVYTPFARACFEAGVSEDSCPTPAHIPGVSGISGDTLADWHLLPQTPDWAPGLRATWTPGEAGAHARAQTFLAGPVQHYSATRDLPALPGTSMLSPHLHFGEISPRRLWHQAAQAGSGAHMFLKELLWREFSLHLLWQHPDMRRTPIRPEFAAFPWREDAAALAAWQRGQTGIPIVDAAMRQLWHTGWMHNRTRMICASFLVKHLLIPWQAGEAWFWDTLCDAGEAANAASWQWVAGCGADAAPYFRIFNPVLQGQKFDPTGTYIRSWVPELAQLPDAALHAPWMAEPDTLTRAGVRLGNTYPAPIIGLAEGRARALSAFAQIKN